MLDSTISFYYIHQERWSCFSQTLSPSSQKASKVMRPKLEKIFCAIDFSDFTDRVLYYGINLAQTFNARLLIFHSVYSPRDPLYGTTLFERGGECKRLTAKAQEAIEQLMQTCPVPWESVVKSGDPVEMAARMARELDVDMVIAASRKFSGLKRMLVGTVVERMARIITRPFLVVRSDSKRTDPIDITSPLQLKQIAVGSNLSTDVEVAVHYAWHLACAAGARLDLIHAMESPLDEDLISPTQGPYQTVQDELQNRLHRLLVQQIHRAEQGEDAVKGPFDTRNARGGPLKICQTQTAGHDRGRCSAPRGG